VGGSSGSSGDTIHNSWHVAEYDEAAGQTAIVDHRYFDAFGELVDRENPTGGDLIDFAAFDFAYTGRPLDSATGLHDYRARWYDAALGRFASEDPIGLAGGDVNLYRYVGNSPANGTDPSGLIVVPRCDGRHVHARASI
jgi:RHS repeat-associated protein